MVNALMGFSFNGMMPLTPAAVSSTQFAILILGLVLALAALMLIRSGSGLRRERRAATNASRRRWKGVHHLGARAAVTQRAVRPRSQVVTLRIAL
jgi:hypothetical protein